MARSDYVNKAQLIAKFVRIAKSKGIVLGEMEMQVVDRAFSDIDNWATFIWISRDLIWKITTYCQIEKELATQIIQEMYSHIPDE